MTSYPLLILPAIPSLKLHADCIFPLSVDALRPQISTFDTLVEIAIHESCSTPLRHHGSLHGRPAVVLSMRSRSAAKVPFQRPREPTGRVQVTGAAIES